MKKNVPAPPTRLSRVPATLRANTAMSAVGDAGAGHMFFLLRMTFWLGLVLVLLPIGTSQRSQSSSEVSATEAISAASATVGDLRGFCDRQPDACTVGSQVATAIGYRAQAGAKMLYDAFTEAMAPHDTGTIAGGNGKRGIITKAAADKPVIERASQNTLNPSDLAPAWRGPQPPRKDTKHSA
jgi:hypothetical protein